MKKRLLTIVIAGLMLFATACGSMKGADSDSYEAITTDSYYAKNAMGFEEAATADYSSEMDMDFAENTGEQTDVDLSGYDTSRKLVYNSYISLESKKFDDDVATVKNLVTSNGGYFESTSTNGSKEDGNRGAGFTARVPADKYDAFMTSVGDVGSVTYKSENVDDITSSYVDVQARLKSLNTKLERLQELEADAENVTELLEIEDRINEVQYQIESYTAQMKTYDDMIDYSTISIDITEVAIYTEVKADSAWNRFAEAFHNSFVGFVSFIQAFVVAIIYLLPYLIIIAIIVLLVIFITKRKKLAAKKKMLKPSQASIEAEDNK